MEKDLGVHTTAKPSTIHNGHGWTVRDLRQINNHNIQRTIGLPYWISKIFRYIQCIIHVQVYLIVSTTLCRQ